MRQTTVPDTSNHHTSQGTEYAERATNAIDRGGNVTEEILASIVRVSAEDCSPSDGSLILALRYTKVL